MTQAARPDPARTPCRDDHVRLGPAPSGTRGQAQLPVGPLALRPRHPVPVWAVVSAGLSPVLATAGWLIAGAAQPASYSPVATTISVMAGHGGTDRWIMTAALFLVGGCQLVTAAGLAGLRVPARIVLAIGGLCSIGIAASPEPVHGSTPQHLAWTALGAVALAVWPALVVRREPPRPLILSGYGCAVVTAVFVALLGWLVIETQGGSDLGLAERLFLSTETCWPFIVAIALRQALRTAGRATDDSARPARSGTIRRGVVSGREWVRAGGARQRGTC